MTKFAFFFHRQVVTTIDIKSRSGNYQVIIGNRLLSESGKHFSPLKIGKKIVILSNDNIASAYYAVFEKSLKDHGYEPHLFLLPAGEETKGWKWVEEVASLLAQNRFERNEAVIALGGGVVGDLAGFVASIYLRGVPFIQIPTTLLAMVDSSVGGKTGINLAEGKNLVGAFYPPRLVLVDLDLLKTLPAREFSAGMAEVIKYGIIADKNLFSEIENLSLEKNKNESLQIIIERCIEIKARIVEEDERETGGQRALLNFGHTIGHAIEKAAGYGAYLHGEAVAIGMRAAAYLSHYEKKLSLEEVQRIENVLKKFNLPLTAKNLKKEKLVEALALDKKVNQGGNRWILSSRLGHAEVVSGLSSDALEKVFSLIIE